MLLLLFALVAAPVLVVIGLVALPTDLATQWSVAVVGIPLAAALFAVWAGILSRPFQWALKPGRFTRDLRAADYRARRLYGLCWTAVYYCTPIYFLVLSLPPLKRLVFRLFGLPGSCDFTTYPDTWLRDLPLVELGPGAYLSNRATIGTNIVMANGRILVDRVRIGARALIGHLSMLGPGADIGSGAEIGVGCGVGLRTRIGPGATIGPMSTVGNGVQIGARTKVGMQCLIGSGATLAAGLRLPDRMHVPRRTVLRTQADVDALNRPQALSEVKDAREILVLKPGLPA
jgi:carbonic anhydrase/acetyltransferase-like protein (isoleucine patch superfamily)